MAQPQEDQVCGMWPTSHIIIIDGQDLKNVDCIRRRQPLRCMCMSTLPGQNASKSREPYATNEAPYPSQSEGLQNWKKWKEMY